MKGGCWSRSIRAWATGHEALAGLLATVAVRMRCSVQASAASVHNNVEHVVQGPLVLKARCAVRAWRCRVGLRVIRRPADEERGRSEARLDRKVGRSSAGGAPLG